MNNNKLEDSRFMADRTDFHSASSTVFFCIYLPQIPQKPQNYWRMASWSYKDFTDETLGLRRRIARILRNADNHISKGVGLNPTPLAEYGVCRETRHPSINNNSPTLNDSFTVTTTIPHSIFLWYLNWITMVSVEPTPFEHSHYFTITFTVRPSLILIMLIPITGALMR